MILSQACSVSCPFRPPLMLWKLCGNDEPALEAIYEDRHRSFGCALYIWNSIHTAWRVHYQPPKYIKHCSELTLTLFVLWIFADNANASFSFNYFAFFANWFYWWSNLHGDPPFIHCSAFCFARFLLSYHFATHENIWRLYHRLFFKYMITQI